MDIDEPELTELPEDFADDKAQSERLHIPFIERPDRTAKDDGKAKSGPPTVAEWQDFIGRTFLRFITDAYVTLAIRDIDHLLTPSEREQIRLSKDDLKELAAPMAELANKSTIMRKRGRMIVASADSVEAIWTLVFWMRRVNRIAKRHRIELARQQTINARVMQPPNTPGEYNGNIREDQGQRSAGTDGSGIGPSLYNPGTG